MKKSFILIAVALLLVSGTAFSQSPLPVGKSQLNLGVGLSQWGVPVYLGFDYSVHKDITIGAEVSYSSYREDYHTVYYRHSIFGISGNGNYHFNSLFQIPQKWDFYAGLNIGFYIWGSPADYPGSHSSGLGIGGQIGGRYYLSDKIGLNLEFGGGNAFTGGKFGISFKL